MNSFIAEIIKALPDAIATAIVTVLLSGVVLFLFQKKIEDFFARSFFVYQTKFTINHAKTIETLETLYKKFMKFNNAIEGRINAKRFSEAKIEQEELRKKDEAIDDLLKDFWNYYRDNRLHLPTTLADSISELYHHTEMITMTIAFALLNAKPNDGHNLEWEKFSMILGKDRYYDAETFFNHVLMELNEKTRHLEFLYKSVAEIKQ